MSYRDSATSSERRRRGRIKRRKFLALLGGAAVWPLTGYAQQPERMRRVGVWLPQSENHPEARARVAAVGRALADFGWVEGKNIRIDYRFASGNPTLFKTYAAELVGLSPDVILAASTPGLAAVREQTRTIPIVFVNVSEPVGQGFVQSPAPRRRYSTSPSSVSRRVKRTWNC